MKWLVTLGTKTFLTDLPDRLDGKFEVKVNNRTFLLEWNADLQTFFLCGNEFRTPLRIRSARLEGTQENIFSEEQNVEFDWQNPNTSKIHSVAAQITMTSGLNSGGIKRTKNIPANLKAHMAGNVLKILVKIGQTVKKGDPLLVLEAMKMENQILSFRDGTIARIFVEEKSSVASGQELLNFEDTSTASGVT